MYQYTSGEIEFLHNRANQFQDQVDRFNSGILNPDIFQQLRLRNGLYVERHAPMLRVAIPYGVLNSGQLNKLAHISRKYDKGYGHFTTRQNIQFNWPSIDDTPKILHELAEVGMHAIQTSGNCIRNVTCDPLAGVAADEIEDPRPWCELIRQWSTLHPEFYWLPRKFKFAFTGAKNDRAAILFHDVGILIYKNDQEETRFKVYVGGGMGRTPIIGKLLQDNISPMELLPLLQSTLRVYNKYGRRDHKYRSRIKILVNDLGIDQFRKYVTATQAEIADDVFPYGQLSNLALQIKRIKSCFKGVAANSREQENRNTETPIKDTLIPVSNPDYENWKQHNTQSGKSREHTIVTLSLKAPASAPGDLNADAMEAVADIASKYSNSEIRVTHEQNLVLPHVHNRNLYQVWHELHRFNLATPNIGKLTDMIACPGLDYCSLANASTIPLAKQLSDHMTDLSRLYDIGNIKLKMSGCMNACGHHHAGHIGILGVDKKGTEWYQITLGGSATFNARIGERLGPAISKGHLIDAIDNIVETYLQIRLKNETFLETVLRVGVAPFKKNLYDDHFQKAKTLAA